METAQNYRTTQFLKDIYRFVRPYRGRFFIATFLRFITDVVWLYPPFAIGQIVTKVTLNPSQTVFNEIAPYLWIWLGVILFHHIMRQLGFYFGFYSAQVVRLDIQNKGVEHMSKLDMRWHEQKNAGMKFSQVQRGGQNANNLLRIWMRNLIEITVNFTGTLIIIAFTDMRITGTLIIYILLYILIFKSFVRKITKTIVKTNSLEDTISGQTFQLINNIRTVKVIALAEKLLSSIWKTSHDELGHIQQRVTLYRFREGLLAVFSYLVMLGLLIFTIMGITKGHYEPGFLIIILGYFNAIYASTRELTDVSQEIIEARVSFHNYMQIINTPVPESQYATISMPSEWQRIVIKNLSFAYGDNKVLRNIDIEIKRGDKIGIVGLSGSGKSTLFKLLLKERDEYKGNILVDNTSLREISNQSFYKQVATVMQDTEVFDMSLKENITISNSKESKNKKLIETALEVAHVKDFIKRLPDGIDTNIGEKGVKLSGGERQRLGIARALFKQPQLLLLDEATSHLDMESEEKIQDSLHKFFQNVTAVVIAHRLTTIKEMDRIIVLEDGKIIEQGSFDQLYKAQGRFYELWNKQLL